MRGASCHTLWFFAALICLAWPALADESLKGRACRSVHLQFEGPEGTAFYNEARVEKTSEGTYFCACGFSQGYFGIQELAGGKKVAIFSVWDPGAQNDPQAVPEDQRVKLVHQGEGVRIGRFGNEGTGGQSFFDYDWQVGETCRFLVTAQVNGPRTEYAGYLYLPQEKSWKHLVTFSTLAKGKLLRGYYSFVEDFRRNRVSATKPRVADYMGGWVLSKEDKWLPLASARFTADSNPAENIDAAPIERGFRLATGGETKNEHARLNERLKREADQTAPPEDVLELLRGRP